MRHRTVIVAVIALIAVLNVVAPSAVCKEYVVMLSRNINLRTGPGTDRFIVGRAWKGDIFELVGEIGNWYEILMFSGDYRYVSKSWSARLTESDISPGHGMSLPETCGTLHPIYGDVLHAKARAATEAGEIIPASIDGERNGVFRRVLEDRHILEVMEIHSVQPALYRALMDKLTRDD
jgi:hypothetical protein